MANTKIPVELSSTPGIVDGSNATAITIDSSENVGIGTTSPFSKTQITETGWSSGAPYGTVLTVTGNDTNDANWGHLIITDSSTGTGNGGMLRFAVGSTSSDISPHAGIDGFTEGSNYGGLKFLTRANGGTATERMRIDSSGNVGIGTTPSSNLTLGYVLRLFGGSQTYISFNNNTHTTQTTGGFVIGNDASAARITQRENQPMVFDTNNTERMRIDSGGGVGINTTSVTGALTVQELSSQVIRSESTSSGTITHLQFVKTSGGAAQIGSITGTTSSVSYLSSSDYRLKENVITDWNATTLLKQLKPSKFNFKDNQSETITGFIAHEIQEILPYLVNGEKDGEDMQSMDYAKLTPLLTKAIQEQQELIETQQTIINDLKSRIETLEG